MSTTLEQLKLHAFGRIGSAGVMSTWHDGCGTQLTDADEHHHQAENISPMLTLTGHQQIASDSSISHRHNVHGHVTDVHGHVTDNRTRVSSGSSRDCPATSQLRRGEQDAAHCKQLQLTDTSKSHTDTDAFSHRRSDTTSASVFASHLTSPSAADSYSLTNAERQRQRENVAMMREFTAQADIISANIASVVDTEYLTLPSTGTCRLPSAVIVSNKTHQSCSNTTNELCEVARERTILDTSGLQAVSQQSLVNKSSRHADTSRAQVSCGGDMASASSLFYQRSTSTTDDVVTQYSRRTARVISRQVDSRVRQRPSAFCDFTTDKHVTTTTRDHNHVSSSEHVCSRRRDDSAARSSLSVAQCRCHDVASSRQRPTCSWKRVSAIINRTNHRQFT